MSVERDRAADFEAAIERIELRKRHTSKCQTKNQIKQWQHLSDSRKRCTCPYWACGVFDPAKGFERRSTGETALQRAKAVLRLRVESGNRSAFLPDQGTRIKAAIEDFIAYTRDGGARE